MSTGTIEAWAGRAAAALAFAVSALAIYVVGFALIDEGLLRGAAVGLSAAVLLLSNPLARSVSRGSAKAALWLVDLALLAGFVYTIFWFFRTIEEIDEALYFLNSWDLFLGLFGLFVVIELTRRTFGPILAGISVLAILYALLGDELPWVLGHGGFSLDQVMQSTWYGYDGVFGFPVGIVASIVVIFIVFGALLEGTGASAVLLKIAVAATARIRGGPAHSAIVASALFGTISGSPTANVVGTGVFTIPLIKRQGFPNSFAGGVEAAASSGGQFTPPIMAAVAFIMADLVGLPYVVVAGAAILPALFYYVSLFASVYTEAVRRGIGVVPVEERPAITVEDWIRSAGFVIPIAVVVTVLLVGRSPAAAGFWAVVAVVLTALVLNRELRRKPWLLVGSLVKGGRQCAQILIAVGAIGIVIGVINQTGIGVHFASVMLGVAEGSLFLALVVAMAACLLLGMGLPTLPAYLIIVLIIGPAIVKLGLEPLLVHLFVLYFGVLSNVTPPVAIAAYAAAPIAGANPLATGFQALRIAAVGFLIPFVFAFNPSLLLVLGIDWEALASIIVRLPLAIWMIATALAGVDRVRIGVPEQALRAAVGIAVLADTVIADTVQIYVPAAVLGIGLVALHRLRSRRSP